MKLSNTDQVLQGEVVYKCKCALIAYHELYRDLQDHRQVVIIGNLAAAEYYIDHIWYSLHAFLVHAANISKILCLPVSDDKFHGNSKKKRKLQGKSIERKELRKSLDIPDDSPLGDTRLRNLFEHFQVELDNRLTNSKEKGVIVDRNIGPLEAICVEPSSSAMRLRNFDPTTCVLTFGRESYCLKPVVEAIQKILLSTKTGME